MSIVVDQTRDGIALVRAIGLRDKFKLWRLLLGVERKSMVVESELNGVELFSVISNHDYEKFVKDFYSR